MFVLHFDLASYNGPTIVVGPAIVILTEVVDRAGHIARDCPAAGSQNRSAADSNALALKVWVALVASRCLVAWSCAAVLVSRDTRLVMLPALSDSCLSLGNAAQCEQRNEPLLVLLQWRLMRSVVWLIRCHLAK